MSIEVRLKPRENIDKALKRLKRKMDEEDIIPTLRDNRFYVKPSERKRKKSARARSRRRYDD